MLYTVISYIRYIPASEIKFVLRSHLKSFVHLLFTCSTKSFQISNSFQDLGSLTGSLTGSLLRSLFLLSNLFQSSGSGPEELMPEMIENPQALAASGKLAGTMKVKMFKIKIYAIYHISI